MVTHTTPSKQAIVHISAYLAGEEKLLGEGEGGMFLSPPTFIGQDPADVDGEVFGGEDGEGRGVPLKRRRGSS